MSDLNDSSSSDSSSEDRLMDFEDDVHSINEIKNQITELKLELDKNAYLYDKHILLIELLRGVKDEEELRKARNNMQLVYPLTEELWLQWIKEDDNFDESLFRLAFQDYMSIDIWIEYTYFSMKKLSETDGDNLVRNVYEEALSKVGLHPTKGCLIWEAYREFEIAMLQSVQPPLGSLSTQEQISKSKVLTKKIEKLFTRQLAIPMKEMTKTFEEYKSFIDSDCDENVLNLYKKAIAYWAEIKPFEDKLENVNSSNIEIYKQYILFEISQQQPARIQCIFERAIKDNCLDLSLWIQYISYLTKLGIDQILLPVHERSVRNCSWSSELWTKYMQSIEKYNLPKEKITKIFNDALQIGFSQSSDILNLWTAYIDSLRRAIDWPSENYTEALDNLRTNLEKAITQLNESFGNDGDPNCFLQQYWAFIEAKYCKNMTKARELWTCIMQKGFGSQARVWLEYISIERSFGDTKHCRKVFQRAINSVSDWPENICDAYLIFERQEGTLLTYEDALSRVEAQLKRIEERKINEALKEAATSKISNKDNKYNHKKSRKDIINSSELKPYQKKNKKTQNLQNNEEQSANHNETETIKSEESIFKKPQVLERKQPKSINIANTQSESEIKLMPPPPPPPKTSLKRSYDEKEFRDQLLAKKKKVPTATLR